MELFFEGLCAFVEVDGNWEVWMGEGGMMGQMTHLASLTAPSLSLKVDQYSLSPSAISFAPQDRLNVFSRIWLIKGHTLEVVTDDTNSTKWQDKDKESVLDLTTIHKNLSPKVTKETAVIKLKGGVLSVHRAAKFKVTVPGKSQDDRDCADVVKWTGSGYLQHKDGRIEVSDKPGPWTVCNSAPDRGGAKHFKGFYEFVDVKPEEQISVEPVRRKDPSNRDNVSEGENCSPPTII